MKTKSTKPFRCKLCDKLFAWKHRLSKHMITHSDKRPSFKCTQCEKSYKSNYSLQKHERVHTGNYRFKCKICDKNYLDKVNLDRHLIVHSGTKPFKCRFCKEAFGRKSCKVKHEMTHTKEKPFKCTECRKGFSRRYILTDHMAKHHEGLSTSTNKNSPANPIRKATRDSKSTERIFECCYCAKEFMRSIDMIDHERSHIETKRFACKLCGTLCANKRGLTKHETGHNKISKKKIKCQNCGKNFIKKDLVKHKKLCEKSTIDTKDFEETVNEWDDNYDGYVNENRSDIIIKGESFNDEIPSLDSTEFIKTEALDSDEVHQLDNNIQILAQIKEEIEIFDAFESTIKQENIDI